jgi:hypothetical protein
MPLHDDSRTVLFLTIRLKLSELNPRVASAQIDEAEKHWVAREIKMMAARGKGKR